MDAAVLSPQAKYIREVIGAASLNHNHSVFSTTRSLQIAGAFNTAWSASKEIKLIDMNKGIVVFPAGITISSWYVNSSVAIPTTELAIELRYVDYLEGYLMQSPNSVLIDKLTTTGGVSSCIDMTTSDLGSGKINTNKIIYLKLLSDPIESIVWHLTINYNIDN